MISPIRTFRSIDPKKYATIPVSLRFVLTLNYFYPINENKFFKFLRSRKLPIFI